MKRIAEKKAQNLDFTNSTEWTEIVAGKHGLEGYSRKQRNLLPFECFHTNTGIHEQTFALRTMMFEAHGFMDKNLFF